MTTQEQYPDLFAFFEARGMDAEARIAELVHLHAAVPYVVMRFDLYEQRSGNGNVLERYINPALFTPDVLWLRNVKRWSWEALDDLNDICKVVVTREGRGSDNALHEEPRTPLVSPAPVMPQPITPPHDPAANRRAGLRESMGWIFKD